MTRNLDEKRNPEYKSYYQEQLDELLSFSKGTFDAICNNAHKLFQDRCQ